MNDRPRKPVAVSRRRFVAVMAAGSAALLARPAAAVAATAAAAKPRTATGTRPRAAAPAGAAMSAAQRKEYDRQKASTLETLKAIRGHAMPPGTEMASVFRARRPTRKER